MRISREYKRTRIDPAYRLHGTIDYAPPGLSIFRGFRLPARQRKMFSADMRSVIANRQMTNPKSSNKTYIRHDAMIYCILLLSRYVFITHFIALEYDWRLATSLAIAFALN